MSAPPPPYPVALYPGCPCYTCDSMTWDQDGFRLRGELLPQRMSLCPSCGNKRCPGAIHHERHQPVSDTKENTHARRIVNRNVDRL